MHKAVFPCSAVSLSVAYDPSPAPRGGAAPAGTSVSADGSLSISGLTAGSSCDFGSGAVSAMAAAMAGGSCVSGAGPEGVGRLRHISARCSEGRVSTPIVPKTLHMLQAGQLEKLVTLGIS